MVSGNIKRRPISAAMTGTSIRSNISRATDIFSIRKGEETTSNIHRRAELTGGTPCTEYAWRPHARSNHAPQAPNISKGLGKRQTKRELVLLEQFVAENLTLMVYRGELCIYEPPVWKRLDEREAGIKIRELLKAHQRDDCLTRRDYQDIRNLLLVNPQLQVERELTTPEDRINMLDGTYDLQTEKLMPHGKRDYFFSCIRARGRDMETCDGHAFESFVRNCSGGDPDIRTQLLQLTALTILKKPLKYFFVLLGESNTGKTQFGRFLEELVGRESVESVRDVRDFSDRWTLGSLEGKTLATCLDLPDGPLPPSAVGIIKQVVGDDPVKGERKYGHPFTFYQKPLLLFAGNHPLRISNMQNEQALLNRMVIIPFRNPVSEADAKQSLYKELLCEAPYIIREAIQAFQELAARNFQITRSEVPEEFQLEEGRKAILGVAGFVKECCVFTPKQECTTADLWAAYSGFAENRGFCHLGRAAFSRSLMSALRSMSAPVEPVKRIGGSDSRGYRGLSLRPEV